MPCTRWTATDPCRSSGQARYSPAAAAVKDVAAGAALGAAVLALAVGLLVLLPRVVGASPAIVPMVPVALGVLCLVLLVIGATRGRAPSRP